VPVDPTSRYVNQRTISVPAPDGSTRTMSAPRIAPEPALQGTYQVVAGDRLDLLGRAATGDTTRWWVLADANRWPDATQLEQPGQTIGLPRA
jgi:nucleoid-associated protein YgaU